MTTTATNPAPLTTRNPWFHADSPYSKASFTYPGKALFSLRGVSVYVNPFYSSYDCVFLGVTIAQRAGFSKDTAPEVIAEILDGKRPVADSVAEHLKAHGFSPMTYSQASHGHN